jgi:hypothetical protein
MKNLQECPRFRRAQDNKSRMESEVSRLEEHLRKTMEMLDEIMWMCNQLLEWRALILAIPGGTCCQ